MTAEPEPPATEQDRRFMRRAIALMRRSLDDPTLGPFGAVVVKDGVVIGEGSNRVIRDRDPTAHAEIVAIRRAAATLGSHDLSGTVLYASAECCPMCLAAAYWARIGALHHASRWSDYADLFADAGIHDEVRRPPGERRLVSRELLRQEALAVWRQFRSRSVRARY